MPIEIDLNGPDGNAFALISYAKKLCEQLELDFKPIKAQMISSNYENLLNVFDDNFGEYVTLKGRR